MLLILDWELSVLRDALERLVWAVVSPEYEIVGIRRTSKNVVSSGRQPLCERTYCLMTLWKPKGMCGATFPGHQSMTLWLSDQIIRLVLGH